MSKYKLSPKELTAEKENLINITKVLNVKNFDILKEVFKLIVVEMLEDGVVFNIVTLLCYNTMLNFYK